MCEGTWTLLAKPYREKSYQLGFLNERPAASLKGFSTTKKVYAPNSVQIGAELTWRIGFNQDIQTM